MPDLPLQTFLNLFQPVTADLVTETDTLALKIGRLIISALVFTVYSTMMFYVMIQVRCRLDGQAYFTILAFLASTGVNLACSIYEIANGNNRNYLTIVSLMVAESVVIAVFYKVLYEMRVVRLKLECQEY